MKEVRMNDSEKKTISQVKGPENRQEWVQTWLKSEGLIKEKGLD